MKKKRRLLCIAISVLLFVAILAGCGAETEDGSPDKNDGRKPSKDLSNATTLTDSTIGEEDGYGYELWKDYGDTTMVLTGDGTFTCEWKNINNALFRRGVKFDCTQTYRDIGNIAVDYEVDYNPDGNSYLCVYGWTREPLVEYYVVESWGSWRPPGGNPIGTITVDGGVYDVYRTVRVNQPSIDGNTTFEQYWSVRQEKSTKGTVNVASHFAAWEQMGMPMGKMYEAALTVEGYQSAGTAEVLKNELTLGGEIIEPELPEPPEPDEPDENGYYFHSTFESGKDDWASRGSSNVSATDSTAAEGAKSLAVTGRTDSWNGAGRDLSAYTFIPGNSYSFSVMAMQDKVDSADFKLTLQYNYSGGTGYTGIASAAGAKGEWVQLANSSFTIPEGAWGLLLYVETGSGTVDFYIDEAIGALDGVEVSFGE